MESWAWGRRYFPSLHPIPVQANNYRDGTSGGTFRKNCPSGKHWVGFKRKKCLFFSIFAEVSGGSGRSAQIPATSAILLLSASIWGRATKSASPASAIAPDHDAPGRMVVRSIFRDVPIGGRFSRTSMKTSRHHRLAGVAGPVLAPEAPAPGVRPYAAGRRGCRAFWGSAKSLFQHWGCHILLYKEEEHA